MKKRNSKPENVGYICTIEGKPAHWDPVRQEQLVYACREAPATVLRSRRAARRAIEITCEFRKRTFRESAPGKYSILRVAWR